MSKTNSFFKQVDIGHEELRDGGHFDLMKSNMGRNTSKRSAVNVSTIFSAKLVLSPVKLIIEPPPATAEHVKNLATSSL